MMNRALVEVEAHNGMVELTIRENTEDAEPLVVILDPHTARHLGDKMYSAGCTCGL